MVTGEYNKEQRVGTMNKNWSSLDKEPNSKKLKRGHIAEYFSEIQFMLHGFETFKPSVDDRGIDLIIRNSFGVFFDIQVKSITGNKNITISKDKFETNNNRLYLVAVQFVDNKDPEMYIIPANELANRTDVFYKTGEKNKKTGETIKQPQYGLQIDSKKELLQVFEFEKYIDKIKVIKK